MEVRHGNSPVRHAASGVVFRYIGEGSAGFLVPKRMEHRHRAAELRLNRWVAGNLETHLAKFSWVTCGVLVLGNNWCNEYAAHFNKQHDENEGESLHSGLPGR